MRRNEWKDERLGCACYTFERQRLGRRSARIDAGEEVSGDSG